MPRLCPHLKLPALQRRLRPPSAVLLLHGSVTTKSQISAGPHKADPTTPANLVNGSASAVDEGYGVSHYKDMDEGPKKKKA
jgi:hypothetical protein